MKKIYEIVSRITYTLTFPITGILLHNSKRVRVLVMHQNEVLLQRSSLGHQKWSVPGGGIEKNENPTAAAIRETLEETGIVLDESMLICLGEQRVSSRKRWPMVDMVFYKAVLPTKQEIVISRPLEILEARWFNTQNLPQTCSKTLRTVLHFAETQE